MNSARTGWERLNCSYFEAVCRQVVSPYFNSYGFTEKFYTVTGGIVYSKGNIFLEIDYEPETYPKYSPTILLGIGRDEHDREWRFTAVPMWFLIPPDCAEAKYPFWTFGTEASLSDVLERMRTTVLEQYAKPLWLDAVVLRKNIADFQQKATNR